MTSVFVVSYCFRPNMLESCGNHRHVTKHCCFELVPYFRFGPERRSETTTGKGSETPAKYPTRLSKLVLAT